MKKILLLPIFAVLLSILSFLPQDAHATSFTATQSGNWNDPATWGGVSPPITINSGDTVTIPAGMTITIPSVTIKNSGFIINFGNITNNFGIIFNGNLGSITNSGTINNYFASLSNSGGTINNINSGTIINSNGASISNSSGGTLNNSGTIISNPGGTINNLGTLNNSGTITSSGDISNSASFTITNSGTFNNLGIITNGGTIVNNSGGTITNSGTLNNYGTTLNNSGGIIVNTNSGIINNSTIPIGTIYNFGTINNNNGSTITNGGTFNNYCGGTITGQINGNQFVNIPCEPPLAITAPSDITVTANTPTGATGVVLGTPTTSGGTPPITITNNAPATFPLGVTSVTWTATDAKSNTSTAIQQVTVNPVSVTIDIKPGDSQNLVNPNSKGIILVAILSTNTFHSITVNPTTVTFGPNNSPAVGGLMKDVNGDGLVDMVLGFKISNTGILCGETSAILNGKIMSGIPIRGSDHIQTINC